MISTKNLLLATAVILSTSTTFARSEEVHIESESVHVPKGFDSNDNVEVVLTGVLPSTCYRRPFGEAKVLGNQVGIDIKATKLDDKESICIMALVPYMISVQLGQLREGSYQIAVNPGTAQEKDSTILVERPNSNSIDNFTYANVTSVKKIRGTNIITLEGVHPSSCMELERVDITANGDTFAILPIIKQVKPICDTMIQPFSYNVELPANLQKDILVHVRKIDGNATNFLLKK